MAWLPLDTFDLFRSFLVYIYKDHTNANANTQKDFAIFQIYSFIKPILLTGNFNKNMANTDNPQ